MFDMIPESSSLWLFRPFKSRNKDRYFLGLLNSFVKIFFNSLKDWLQLISTNTKSRNYIRLVKQAFIHVCLY
jgi:hypothetical protein